MVSIRLYPVDTQNCQDGLGLRGYIRNFIKYLSVTDHLGPYAGVW